MKEKWIKWQPLDNLSPKYYVDTITYNLDGFKILLSDSKDRNKNIKVIFDESLIYTYKSTDKSYRLKTISTLDENYGPRFYSEWTFFKIINSSYISWVLDETYETVNPEWMKHFSFLAVDSIVDIIASEDPKFEIINQK